MYSQKIVDIVLQNQQLALISGNPPFAAVIECEGKILCSISNDSRTSGNPLHHAEILAIQEVIENYDPKILQKSHLFASNEPCPMCVGACIWSGIPNVTYFLAQEQIKDIRGWGIFIPALDIASSDDSGICISGPVGNDEMLQMHREFWTSIENFEYKHSIHLKR